MGTHFDYFPGNNAMLRFAIILLSIMSCSMPVVKTGGDRSYTYLAKENYSLEKLQEMSKEVVESSEREPPVGKLADLFSKNQKPIKRIGIIVFESKIQPTRGGLATQNEIFLSEQGKQLLTEKFLNVWEESFKTLKNDLDYVSTAKIKKAPNYNEFGLAEDDYIKTYRSGLAPDDIFFLEPGKKTTLVTVVNPRGMRDMSFALVPAYELMGGPKWSEHNKHFLSEVAKKLNLDAAIIVMSEVSWTKAHTDKHSGENYQEQIDFKLSASTLVPFSEYHNRLEKTGNQERPGVTLCYKSYESSVHVPARISVEASEKTFSTIESEVLNPVLKTYTDLSQMMILRIVEDIKKTW